MSAQRSFCSLLGSTRSGTASDRPAGLGRGSVIRRLRCVRERFLASGTRRSATQMVHAECGRDRVPTVLAERR